MSGTAAVVLSVALGLTLVGSAVRAAGGAPGVRPQTPEEAAATSLAAAAAIFDADPDPACTVGGARACLQPSSTPEQAARGIARFGVSGSGPEGQGAFLGILGRDPDGAWRFWFGTQNVTYQLLALPGAMTVCADGDGLNVRALPGVEGEVLATLADFSRVTAEQFTLTRPGTQPTATAEQVVGEGWYYLSAPVAGWASSRYLEDAAVAELGVQAPCALRDAFVRP